MAGLQKSRVAFSSGSCPCQAPQGSLRICQHIAQLGWVTGHIALSFTSYMEQVYPRHLAGNKKAKLTVTAESLAVRNIFWEIIPPSKIKLNPQELQAGPPCFAQPPLCSDFPVLTLGWAPRSTSQALYKKKPMRLRSCCRGTVDGGLLTPSWTWEVLLPGLRTRNTCAAGLFLAHRLYIISLMIFHFVFAARKLKGKFGAYF